MDSAEATAFDIGALLEESFERAAERSDDITPLVYEKFFTRRPDAREYFTLDIIDPLAKGRMLAEIIDVIMGLARGETYIPSWVKSIAADHQAYGLRDRTFYLDFFDALRDVLRETAADSWTPAMDHAWACHLAALSNTVPALPITYGAS